MHPLLSKQHIHHPSCHTVKPGVKQLVLVQHETNGPNESHGSKVVPQHATLNPGVPQGDSPRESPKRNLKPLIVCYYTEDR
jgi:hypothetical protein